MINTDHPNIFLLIKYLKKIETESMIQLEKVRLGKQISSIKRIKDCEKDLKIESIKRDF